MTKRRVLIISFVAVIIFGLLIGGKILYQKQWIDSSILTQSQKISGIVSVKTVQGDGQAELDVTTQHIANLRQVSLSLETIVGKEPIRYLDHRNASLTTLFDQMQFPIQEGITRGNFTEMQQSIQTMAKKAGVQVQLQMDSDNIYVLLEQGKAQLIEVVERHDQGQFLPSKELS
ncbi:hypothetical protein Desaci_3216 [Desulfosporosinus acidiphilus SJ4]|uniref:Uncharacterized protein n=1 Tax=Desulfosporosinus acidiphilus (strain DSM 22704 / JCM 16185 / SJ4) TaxID=646529 RepID=I4D8J3_DESAJ|nr:hypothetical protein [Desulfosporosinus acidiphilus]AFM42117.1 hypothetical protein Desaci_3216 [Desulfosporosinus acidiphilus SJ4]